MGKRTTLVLAILAGALLAFILLYERDLASTDALGEREGRLLPVFERDDVDALVVARGDGPAVEVRRVDDDTSGDAGVDPEALFERRWRLVRPVEDRADSDVVETLLGTLDWAEPRRTLAQVSAEDRETFGLTAPRVTLTVRTGGREVRLLVGGEAPQGGLYAQREDAPDVAYVVGAELLEALDHGPDHFRDDEVLRDTAVAEADALRVRTEAGEVRLVRGDGDRWRLESPVDGLAAETRVDAALRALADLEAQAFVDEDPGAALADYGLDAPALVVVVARGGGDGAFERTMRVGSACAEPRGARHARVDDGPVVCVDEAALDPLRHPIEAWRERRLTAAATEDVQRVRLAGPGGALVLERAEGGWRFRAFAGAQTDGTPTAEGPAEARAVEALVGGLATTEAEMFLPATDRDLRAAALLEPARTVVLERLDGGEERLAFGGPSPSGLFARRGDEGAIVAVARGVEALVDPSPTRFRRTSLEGVDPASVRRIEVDRAGGPREVLERLEGESVAWRLVEPVDAPGDRVAVQDLLDALADLQALRWVAEAPRPEHGLAAPRADVTLALAPPGADAEGGAEGGAAASLAWRLRVGADAPAPAEGEAAGVYAQLDEGGVFVAPATVLARFAPLLADRGALATDRADVEAITLERDGRTVVLDLDRSPSVRDALGTLRAAAVEGYGPPPARTGLASAPRLRVMVRRRAGAEEPLRYTLRVGSPPAGETRLPVRREDLPVTYLVLESDLAPLFDAAP